MHASSTSTPVQMTTSLLLQLYPLPEDSSWISLIACFTFPWETVPHIQQASKDSENEATIMSCKSALSPDFSILLIDRSHFEDHLRSSSSARPAIPDWLGLPCSTCSMTLRAFLAAHPPMETWSSVAALVERESTDEGWHRALFSETVRGQCKLSMLLIGKAAKMTCGFPKRSTAWNTLSRSSWSLTK